MYIKPMQWHCDCGFFFWCWFISWQLNSESVGGVNLIDAEVMSDSDRHFSVLYFGHIASPFVFLITNFTISFFSREAI